MGGIEGKGVDTAIVWMRRALRVADNAPLWHAITSARTIVPVLVLQTSPSYAVDTPRRAWIRGAIRSLSDELRRHGSRLLVLRGRAEDELPRLAASIGAGAVFAARAYDPVSIDRDNAIRKSLNRQRCSFETVKDAVLFEQTEVVGKNGAPYSIFTPYYKNWLNHIEEVPPPFPMPSSFPACTMPAGEDLDAIKEFARFDPMATEREALKRLSWFLRHPAEEYAVARDFPAVDGTSRLSSYLSIGLIGIRTILAAVLESSASASPSGRKSLDAFLRELVWREFYYQVLANHPEVIARPFRAQFANLAWSTSESHFATWCEGRTGYPIVDAGMRQLNATGWIHNRVRMIVASFLTKDLHMNWQTGERFFFERLIDADIASNNGGWQWSAGTGTDASPYFRILNPILQSEQYDPKGEYIRRYVPELRDVSSGHIHAPWKMTPEEQRESNVVIGKGYPAPIVQHQREREAALDLVAVIRRGHRGSL